MQKVIAEIVEITFEDDALVLAWVVPQQIRGKKAKSPTHRCKMVLVV